MEKSAKPLYTLFTEHNSPSLLQRQLLIAGFFPLVLFILAADSRYLMERGINGQIISNIIVPIYLILMLRGLPKEQKPIVIAFVPISAMGELILSLVFKLYTYKFGMVPFYVPFGHAVLLSTGLLIVDLPFVILNKQQISYLLLAIHLLLFSCVVFLFHDSFSALFGVLFFSILWRNKAHPFYLFMGFLALFVELIGTFFGCWIWDKSPWIFYTTNPPLGAMVIYVIGDIIVMKITPWLKSIRTHASLVTPKEKA